MLGDPWSWVTWLLWEGSHKGFVEHGTFDLSLETVSRQIKHKRTLWEGLQQGVDHRYVETKMHKRRCGRRGG